MFISITSHYISLHFEVIIMKKIKFVRFDWVSGADIQDLDTQINAFLKDHPNYKVIDYKFTAFYDPYVSSPAEAALIEFEVHKVK